MQGFAMDSGAWAVSGDALLALLDYIGTVGKYQQAVRKVQGTR